MYPDEEAEVQAFGIAIGRPLSEFPEGTYVFFVRAPGPISDEFQIPEEEPGSTDDDDDLDDDDEDDDEDEGYKTFKHAEAPTLFALLRILVAKRELGIDPDPSPYDNLVRDEKLKGDELRFRAIADLRLRRIAMELESGANWNMEPVARYEDTTYFQGILKGRRGWKFLRAWESTPPNGDMGACILYRKAPKKKISRAN